MENQNKLLGSVLVDKNIHSLRQGENPALIIDQEDVGPCSVDMKVGDKIFQVAGLPSLSQGFNFSNFLNQTKINELDASDTLSPNSVYIMELKPQFNLPESIWGYVNPKSTAGRLDFECRTIAEGATRFNFVPKGYQGKLYMLAVPQSFWISDVCGQDFVQLRLYDGRRNFLTEHDLTELHKKYELVSGAEAIIEEFGVTLHLDLKNYDPISVVSVPKGKPLATRQRGIDPKEYFYEKKPDKHGNLYLEPGQFMLAGTIEKVRVPTEVCMEMQAYTDEYGPFLSHYAGFIDPGFGFGRDGSATPSSVVCEIRNISSVPLIFRHGQRIGLCRYEYVREQVEVPYGESRDGKPKHHYQGQQGIKFAKCFGPWTP